MKITVTVNDDVLLDWDSDKKDDDNDDADEEMTI
jgi:hypothetical protein